MKRVQVPSLTGSPVSVWWDDNWQEFQVKIAKHPKMTYHTDDRQDAIATAQKMRNDVELMTRLFPSA